MYMILFEELDTLQSGDMRHVVSAIRRIKDTDEAAREWQKVQDVYSAFIVSDVPDWGIRLITPVDK